ncbi:MAG: 16S rRNA (guanine(527)-N(7))-methyltransferase RsmG [Desulfobacula sp.]|nr:16S rRNA (guanine(527)-N(7))-methyltransferase RsmG [Desulfobacula sp.]
MVIHAKELMLWNKKINLTAIREPLQIVEKHFIDSIATLSFLGNQKHVIDMGAGGGFPGIPLKIMNPLLYVVLVDSSRKKVNFLKHVIRLLGLKNIDAIHSRVEDLHNNDNYKGQFDVVISRAFTELSNFTRLGIPFLKTNGFICALKGKNAVLEITPDIKAQFTVKTSQYTLPFEKSLRYIIRLSKKN